MGTTNGVPRMAEGRVGGGCGRGSFLPATRVRRYYLRKFLTMFYAKSCILGNAIFFHKMGPLSCVEYCCGGVFE